MQKNLSKIMVTRSQHCKTHCYDIIYKNRRSLIFMEQLSSIQNEVVKIYCPPSQKRIPKYSDTDEVKIYVVKK